MTGPLTLTLAITLTLTPAFPQILTLTLIRTLYKDPIDFPQFLKARQQKFGLFAAGPPRSQGKALGRTSVASDSSPCPRGTSTPPLMPSSRRNPTPTPGPPSPDRRTRQTLRGLGSKSRLNIPGRCFFLSSTIIMIRTPPPMGFAIPGNWLRGGPESCQRVPTIDVMCLNHFHVR